MNYPLRAFDESSISAFMPVEKIGLVASVNPDGLPHVTLITSIRASGPSTVTLGEFCKGTSKTNIAKNPKTAFLIMTMDRRLWRGHAVWTHLKEEGPEFESYNDLPMFRYNAYFGINTVHYLDLVDAAGPAGLPLPSIIAASLATLVNAKGAATHKSDKAGNQERILSFFGEKLINTLGCLKFLAYIKDDGFPEIIPILQCRAAGSSRLVFSFLAYGAELKKVPAGATVAVFSVTMQMEDVLVRGRFSGISNNPILPSAYVDIDWVYNSMPPGHGQIWPPVPLSPVREWDDFFQGAA
ncbi:MAG: pyridoxamine 5'-phosphate oxidase family protein [Deltaproteobacteria bacterium]|nr:pyridoxamine 5'-phosphate oxidase family protein [Deltaproteobacteria bacterium]